jgi:D-glycero-alpha-D-manno-heptose 1-phosphate guanylyltransferase
LEAIILAGGFGTRLKKVVSDVPKSMALIHGRPFLEYLMDYLISQGITRAVLSVGYKRGCIMDHFGSRYKTLEVDYAIEEEPLGTGGGIRLAFWKVNGLRAFVMNGDSLFRFDFGLMLEQHLKRKADVTLALRKLRNTGRYGRVEMNRNRRITAFSEKDENAGPGLINGGVYVIEKLFLMEPDFRGRFSIEKDCFERMFTDSRMFGFPASGYFLDIGIPEDFNKAQHEFAEFRD